MKTFSTLFGATAIFLGLIVAAGSAGDCDGKCMEQANDLATMLMIAGTGLVLMIAGAFFVLVGQTK